jgi:hypothetical protein
MQDTMVKRPRSEIARGENGWLVRLVRGRRLVNDDRAAGGWTVNKARLYVQVGASYERVEGWSGMIPMGEFIGARRIRDGTISFIIYIRAARDRRKGFGWAREGCTGAGGVGIRSPADTLISCKGVFLSQMVEV